MSRRPGRSIRGKLTQIIMLTSTTAVLLACLGFVISDLVALRNQVSGDLSTLAQVVGSNSTAALAFGDRQAAHEVLNALRAKASIVAARIYTEHGETFASYETKGSIAAPALPGKDGFRVTGDRVELIYAIRLDGQRIGTLYIAADSRERNARLKEYAAIAAGIVLVALLLAFFLSSRLQRSISAPIVELARVANEVSQDKNFSVRAHGSLNESAEIGNLLSGFNSMLAEIQQRDDRLLRNQTDLEETVALRTGELTAANEKLVLARNVAERTAEIDAQLARESALILNSATDGIVGIDLDARPTFLNPAAARMLGRTLSELQGRPIHEAFHHCPPDGTSSPDVECIGGRALSRGEPFAESGDTFWRPDGSSFPVEYSATSIVDEKGNKLGAVMMFRDVTERRAIERLKSEFVSTVSHELRTPLTSIRGALGLLSSGLLGPIAEKGQRMLTIAVSNTDRLIRLINDILDLERIDSGRVELTRAAVDANTVMVQAMEGVQSMADQGAVRLMIVPVTSTLWGDSDRIVQTLTNLLGNAIKFSPPNTTVTLSGVVKEADFVFYVADQGRGVPEQKLETIFGRFSQVDASDSREKGGSGLGLAICQSIVTAHGGRIWAERNDPAGTRVQFTIPLAVRSIGTPPGFGSSASGTILLCQSDDSPSIVELLKRHRFRVVRASSSDDVIARTPEVQPDAIILDVADGGLGWRIVEVLKSSAETRYVPVVIANGQFAREHESFADAVANWVREPLNGDELIHALDLACGGPSVLVVEDDLDLARVMTTALRGHGIRTLHTVSGNDGIQLCREHEPDLLVLDLGLPDIDGFAVVRALRESPTLGQIPLVVYSALDVGSADQSRLRLGPTEFLTKSRCSLADFEGHVIRLLDAVAGKTNDAQHAA